MTNITSTTSSAPGKLMLAGSYAVVHGRPALVTAIDQRIKVTVKKNTSNFLTINAPDVGVSNYSVELDKIGLDSAPKGVTFVEAAVKLFFEQYSEKSGLEVSTHSDFSSSVGFGSSSAVTVAFVHALFTLSEQKLTKKELFDFCYKVVLSVQGVGSGFDIASAIWGGTIKYVKPAVVIEELNLTSDEFFDHVVVCYSGEKAETAPLIKQINQKLEEEPEMISELFDQIGQTAEKMYAALQNRDWQQAGEELLEHQRFAAQLGVSTDKIEEIIATSLQNGAYGASLSGAGGGDSVPIFVSKENKQKLISALETVGQVISVSFNAPGVRVEDSI